MDSVSSKSVSMDCSRVPNATLGVSNSTLDASSDLDRFDRLLVGDDLTVDGALRFKPCTRTLVDSLMYWSDIFQGGRDTVPGKLEGWESAHNKHKPTGHYFVQQMKWVIGVQFARDTCTIAGSQLTVVITLTRHRDNAVVEKGANSCCAAADGFPLRIPILSFPRRRRWTAGYGPSTKRQTIEFYRYIKISSTI